MTATLFHIERASNLERIFQRQQNRLNGVVKITLFSIHNMQRFTMKAVYSPNSRHYFRLEIVRYSNCLTKYGSVFNYYSNDRQTFIHFILIVMLFFVLKNQIYSNMYKIWQLIDKLHLFAGCA